MKQKYYFIATMRDIKKDSNGWIDFGGSRRTVGFYKDLETAKKAVEENWCDIYEHGYYKYAVIEAQDEGLYSCCDRALFYKWKGDIETGRYVRCKKPAAAYGFCNFTF